MKQQGLHECSELPTDGPVLDNETNKVSWYVHRDKYALDYIKNRFAASKAFAGKGMFGTVVALNDVQFSGKASIAVKILPFSIDDSEFYEPALVIRDVEQELFIACQVNALHDWTPVFVQTFGWLVSQHIPKDWKMFVDVNSLQYKEVKKLSYMFLFMEQATYKFDSDSVAFSVKGYLTLIFIILHALYVAKKELGFTHSDLHKGNIMIDVVHGKTAHLKMDEDTTIVVNLFNQYMPKLIDFGHAKTYKASDGGRNKNDVASLFGAIYDRATKYDPKLDISVITNFKDFNASLEDLLLKHPIFDSIRVTSAKRQKVIEKCSMCGSEATMRFETSEKYKFCHEYCANKMNGLAFLI